MTLLSLVSGNQEQFATAYLAYFMNRAQDLDVTEGGPIYSLFVDGLLPVFRYIAEHVKPLSISLTNIARGDELAAPQEYVSSLLDTYAQALFAAERRKASNAECLVNLVLSSPNDLVINNALTLSYQDTWYYIPKKTYTLGLRRQPNTVLIGDFIQITPAQGLYVATVPFVATQTGSGGIRAPGDLFSIPPSFSQRIVQAQCVSIGTGGFDDETNQDFALRLLRYVNKPSLFGSSGAFAEYIRQFVHPHIDSRVIPAQHMLATPRAQTLGATSQHGIDVYVRGPSPVTSVHPISVQVVNQTARVCSFRLPRELVSGMIQYRLYAVVNGVPTQVNIEPVSVVWPTVTSFKQLAVPTYPASPIMAGAHVAELVYTFKELTTNSQNQYVITLPPDHSYIDNVYYIERLHDPAVEFVAQELFSQEHVPLHTDLLLRPAIPCFVRFAFTLRKSVSYIDIFRVLQQYLRKLPLGTSTLHRNDVIRQLNVLNIEERDVLHYYVTGTIPVYNERSISADVIGYDLVIPTVPNARVSPLTTYFTLAHTTDVTVML